jgi:hypothetical protein
VSAPAPLSDLGGAFSLTEVAMAEPDCTVEIVTTDDGWILREGGVEISRVFETEEEAKWWADYHRNLHQPECCFCGSAESRPDDPLEIYSCSRRGPDWMHKSCTEKLHADDWMHKSDM